MDIMPRAGLSMICCFSVLYDSFCLLMRMFRVIVKYELPIVALLRDGGL